MLFLRPRLAVGARGLPRTFGSPGPQPVPSWVPPAGEVATFTGGGSVLTNNFRAVADPNGIGYDPFHTRKVLNYSSRFLHESWREFGGLVIWGGGHSATNYNGLGILTFAASTMYYECLQAPFDWAASLDTGDITSEVNSYGEATGSSPLKLACPHSYGSGDIVDGKFVQVYAGALGYINIESINAQHAHEIDLSNPATSYNSRAWVRRTSTTGGWAWTSAPALTRYVPPQGRIFQVARGGGGPYSPQWFNLGSNAWETGTGTGFNYPDGTIEAGALMWVEARNLLVLAYRNSSGNVVLQYMDVAAGVTQPTLGGTATLSSTLTVPAEWGAACWCPDSNRILIAGVTSNTDKVYEITIPSTLSNTWTVDTAGALPGGATINPDTSANVGMYGKSFDYNRRTRCIVIYESFGAISDGVNGPVNDVVKAYRPRFT